MWCANKFIPLAIPRVNSNFRGSGKKTYYPQMDAIFKFTVETYGFSSSSAFAPTWIQQIVCIQDYWEMLIDSFDFDSFTDTFNLFCTSENLEYNIYSLESAFEKAKTVWKVPLMIEISNRIAHLYTDDYLVGEVLVFWCEKSQRIQLKHQLKTHSNNLRGLSLL